MHLSTFAGNVMLNTGVRGLLKTTYDCHFEKEYVLIEMKIYLDKVRGEVCLAVLLL